MAKIAPFQGLRYNTNKIADLGSVVIPPYDVISPSEQKAFYEVSPYNMIRLELGETTDGDSESDNPHTRAAECLRRWREEGILIRDDLPAVYQYELDYSVGPGDRRTRSGFICALRLEEFGGGGVCPHEKTFSKVKDERLQLMLACHANLSPVFGLYSDAGSMVDETLIQAREHAPVLHFTDREGMEHRIRRVTDLDALARVRDRLQNETVFIADGHHRYETALNYRDIQRQCSPDAPPRAPFEYVMIYLSNMEDPGLTILPAHRLLRNLNGLDPDAFLRDLEGFFRISGYDATDGGERTLRRDLQASEKGGKIAVGFAHRGGDRFYLLEARQDRTEACLADRGFAAPLRRLQVVVLDQVILQHVLGLSEEFLGDESNIHFKHDLSDALAEVRSGEFDAAFVVNATRIEQVREIARAGLTMPHKSTYFYPKVGSGMVIRSLDSEEELVW